MVSWRIHKAITYCVMGLIAAGLLGFFGINLQDKVFGILPWNIILGIGGMGYLVWAFTKMLHF